MELKQQTENRSKSFHPILNPNFILKTTPKVIDPKDSLSNIQQSITDDYYKIPSYFEEIVRNPFGERWSDTVNEIKKTSPFRNFETYSVFKS
jgi:hypothetical protein